MKVEWEEKDVWVGRRFHKPGTQWESMIGFIVHESREKDFVTISLADGMVGPRLTRKEMAEYLNDDDYVPSELLSQRP